MSFERPLRGRCRCGRNQYFVEFPRDVRSAGDVARVLFDSRPTHRLSNASPLAAFLRIPLAWYHSTTVPFFPDETSAMIHRAYTSPDEQHAMRYFCGFCGTPLSYWSEEPRTEAEFIQVTLGSLSANDLADLDDLGLLPDSEEEENEAEETAAAAAPGTPRDGDAAVDEVVVVRNGAPGREIVGGLPWFDTLVAGSRLGNMRASKGSTRSRDGSMRVEWEIVEWIEDTGDNVAGGKRKYDEVDTAGDPNRMEGVQH